MRAILALAVLALAAPAGAVGSDDLIGTWHVLVHYRDANSHDPEALRWEDRIWVFERHGEDLRWTEYPILVFRDEEGRFERLGTSAQSRVVHAWEPNPDQRAQIRGGLEVNERGKKTKTLRGSDAAGWRSTNVARPTSATIITYVENWSIEKLGGMPVFAREDVMGSSSTESLEGATRYTTAEVGAGELRGSFERDGTRQGTFRMTRAGAVANLKGSSEEEWRRKRAEHFEGQIR